jgi:hypothetical protein
MTVLKRIGPASAFKIGLVSYGLLGLLAGIVCSLIALSGAPFAAHTQMPLARAVGMMAVIVCPIVYGILGGLASAIGAFVYNLASGWVGGVEVEIHWAEPCATGGEQKGLGKTMIHNVGGMDRILRLILGGTLLLAGLALLSGATTLGVTLTAVGLLVLLTGMVRFCVLYLPFGISTAKPGGRPRMMCDCTATMGSEKSHATGAPRA